ncbi:MAG: hypothetical protein ACUVQ8_02635 [Nitrososphaeria archaeon]
MQTLTFLSGIHSRSEELIDSTRAFDKAEIGASTLMAHYKRDTERLIGLEVEAQLDLICDGMLRWHDPLRLFVESINGIILGPYLRWFETNTFFRQPIVVGELGAKRCSPTKMFFVDLLPLNRESLVVLPGPYTLSRLSQDNYYRGLEELVLAYSQTLDHIIQKLLSKRKFGLILSEPCLAYESTRPDKKISATILEVIERIASKPSFCLIHTCFGDACKISDMLTSFSRPWIGIDLTQTPVDALPIFRGRKVAFGILDSFSPIVETSASLKRSIDLIKRVDFESIAFCPNTDLRYLPRQMSDSKMLSLRSLKEAMEN